MESNNINEKARFTCKRVAEKAVVRKKEDTGKFHKNREKITVYNHRTCTTKRQRSCLGLIRVIHRYSDSQDRYKHGVALTK